MQADEHCMQSVYDGTMDWRLPTPQELLTIVDNSRYNPATNYSFTGMPMPNSTYLWTSKQYNGNTAYAYIFSPSFGWYDGFDTSGYLKSNTYKVLCVRGDEMQPVTSAKFTTQTINWNVVVTDSATGLMWQKSYATDKTWQQALNYCENSTYAGYSDWRLPNKNELASLVNYEKAGAPYSDFPNMPSEIGVWWWSSSTSKETNSAWFMSSYYGHIGYYYKSSTYYVRCVR